ncbi:MAG: L-carnitine dehydratase/bile acid-inducible protein [Acidimicrobiales bacterium]|nr:L-carnitine dehydratase/bile acid-inducible protein [Acidimicrobiales bacterium]
MVDTRIARETVVTQMPDAAALRGLKIVEIAHVIAGPLAGGLMADLGADVIHVEPPVVGDAQRVTGNHKDGVYLWWKVSGRNKRSVTLDLRQTEGQQIAHDLVRWADVVITNFRVETLEKWHLDWPSVHEVNPKVVMLQVTGFGADTTLRNSPGFGKVGEAMSGVVHLTGFPDGPPIHTGFSHGDSVTGLFGAFSVLAAIYRRDNDPDFDGEWIDLALFEGLYRLCEWQVIMYDQLGVPPLRAGNRLANAPAPVVNTYLSLDDIWITVTSGTPRAVEKVAALLGEPASDYDEPRKQYERADRLDELLRQYVAGRTADEALEIMARSEVVASKIFSAKDIVEDPTYIERGNVIEIDDPDLGTVKMQRAFPKMANHGGAVWRTGAKLGEDNARVYQDILGLSAEEIDRLEGQGVI